MLHLLHYTRFADATHAIDKQHLLAFLQYSVQYLIYLSITEHEALLLGRYLPDNVLLCDVVGLTFGNAVKVIAVTGMVCLLDLWPLLDCLLLER